MNNSYYHNLYKNIFEMIDQDGNFKEHSDIEDALSVINHIESEIDFLSNLKKQRSIKMDSELNRKKDSVNRIREAIKRYMQNNNKKTMSFPGVGRVTVSSRKGGWEINDEQELIKYLKNNNIMDKYTEQKIVLKDDLLDDLFDSLEQNSNSHLDNFAKRKDAKTSTTIKYDESFLPQELEPNDQPETHPEKLDLSKKDDKFDNLEI